MSRRISEGSPFSLPVLKNGIRAAVFLIAGLFVIAVGIPVTYSGVGGGMRGGLYCPTCPTSPPKGTFIILNFPGYTILFEPAFFIGVILIVIGVFLLRQSVKTLGIRTDKKPVTSVGMR
jgi:hypothetical protein